MGARRAERQVVVDATPQECFDALVDFESYPDWQQAVAECEVRSRDRDGRGRRVYVEIAAKVTRIAYTVDYSYEEPHLISWVLVEGDLRGVDGELVLEDRGDGTTLATYALRIDGGRSMPAKLASVLSDQMTRRSVEDLKARVEATG